MIFRGGLCVGFFLGILSPLFSQTKTPIPDFEGAKNVFFGAASTQSQRDMLLQLLKAEADTPDSHVLVWGLEDDNRFQAYLNSRKLIVLDSVSTEPVAWARDTGPISVRDADGKISAVLPQHTKAAVNHQFDYSALSKRFAKVLKGASKGLIQPEEKFDLILEGGNFLTDGKGTCVTSTKTLANNKSLDINFKRSESQSSLVRAAEEEWKNAYGSEIWAQNLARDLRYYTPEQIADVESKLKAVFGCKKVIFLETSDELGHVDMLMTFTDSQNIVFQSPPLSSKNGYLQKQFVRNLSALREAGYQVHLLASSAPQQSYTNIFISKTSVLVPQYSAGSLPFSSPDSEPTEEQNKAALELYRKLFPSKKIVSFDSTETLESCGSIRCRTNPVFEDLSEEVLLSFSKPQISACQPRHEMEPVFQFVDLISTED